MAEISVFLSVNVIMCSVFHSYYQEREERGEGVGGVVYGQHTPTTNTENTNTNNANTSDEDYNRE